MASVLVFYFGLLLGIYLSFTKRAAFIFVTYEVFYFVNPEVRWWGGEIIQIPYSMLLVLLMLALSIKSLKNNKIKDGAVLIWCYWTLSLYAIAYLYAVYPEQHYEYLVYFFKLIIIITLAYKLILTKKDLELALFGYIGGAFYASFYVFQVGRNSGDRVEGVGLPDAPDSNGLAAAIAPSLVFCVYYFWIKEKLRDKVIFAVAGVFIANALVLINSRGAFLGVAASLMWFLYTLYFASLKRKFQKTFVVMLILVGASGGLYIADESFINRITGIAGEADVDRSEESGGTRLFYWKAAFDMAVDYPFGNGYRGFNYFAPQYLPADLNTGASLERSVHSTWFEALSETGYLGLWIFIVMIYSAFNVYAKAKKSTFLSRSVNDYYLLATMQASLLAFLVAMTFLNRMRAEVLYWQLCFAAIAANFYLQKNTKANELKKEFE